MNVRFLFSVLIAFFCFQLSSAVHAQSFTSVPSAFDPTAFGIETGAVEIPSLRTEKTVTFRLPNGDFTQVSDGTDRFTRDERGTLVPVSDTGEETLEGIVFDHLPKSTVVTFDSDFPAYTYRRGDHFFRLSYTGRAKAIFEKPNVVSYTLSDHAVLRFAVKGTTVLKAITIDGPVNPNILRFTVTQDQSLTQRSESGGILLQTATGTVLFRASAPFLLSESGTLLKHAISIRTLGNGQYVYDYDPRNLPSVYIIDPSTCSTDPGTLVNDTTGGGAAWVNPTRASYSDDSYATISNVMGVSTQTNYLKATNFGFQIPFGTVKGVTVRIERHAIDDTSVKDSTVQLVETGSFVGDNKASTTFWPNSDVTKIYGSGGALWGIRISSTQANRSDFGVALAVQCLDNVNCLLAMDNQTEVSVDHISMALTYAQMCETSTGAAITRDYSICVKPKYFSPQIGGYHPLTGTGMPLCNETGCYLILPRIGTGGLASGVHAYQPGYEGDPNPTHQLDNNSPGTTYPFLVHFGSGYNSNYSKIADALIQFQPMTGLSGGNEVCTSLIYANTSAQKSVFHFASGSGGLQTYQGSTFNSPCGGIFFPACGSFYPKSYLGGTGFTLFVPKSVAHDQVRVCQGKRTLGCTGTGSWFDDYNGINMSFVANDQGRITSTSGSYLTGGVVVRVENGYWRIEGLYGTGGEGGDSNSGGGGSGGFAVPEFSALGLIAVLAGCGYMMKKKMTG